jgi:hypothetical protein
VNGPVTNDGSIGFNHAIGKFAGAISGTGNFAIGNATLEFDRGVSKGEQIGFGGSSAVGTLKLESASSFHGAIETFFSAGDTVDATTFAKSATTFLYTQTGTDSCTWTLTDGAHKAVLNFSGDPYVRSDFSIVSANHGAGSAIEFV